MTDDEFIRAMSDKRLADHVWTCHGDCETIRQVRETAIGEAAKRVQGGTRMRLAGLTMPDEPWPAFIVQIDVAGMWCELERFQPRPNAEHRASRWLADFTSYSKAVQP